MRAKTLSSLMPSLSVLVRVLWRNGINRGYMKIYYKLKYKVLANMIMEAEMCHSLSSASWNPRKSSGIVWRSESQGADDADSSWGFKPEDKALDAWGQRQ